MKLWNYYYTPASVDEAVALLQRYAGEARIIAGGTDLLVEMLESHHNPIEALIDITHIPDLCKIEARDGYTPRL
jgi:carbon-monoxide dehydrogenase medium subunit